MGPKIAKERLDVLLVTRELAPSREKAQGLIRAGQVVVNDERVDKPGTKVKTDAAIRLKGNLCPYVSRGGYKLAGAIEAFQIPVEGRIALDVGSSTGGFTDVLLQNGAKHVIAVDVGTNQLAYSIRQDERVSVYEKTNFRTIAETETGTIIREQKPTLIVGDVSFISLTLILPSVAALVNGPADVVFLVKPQFEVGRGEIGKGGIVRNEAAREESLRKIVAFCTETLHWTVNGTMLSPIQGTQGNIEYLMHAQIPSN